MITLEQACEIYTKADAEEANEQNRPTFPIDSIQETPTSWVFTPNAFGMIIGFDVPVISKATGDLTYEPFFGYNDAPRVAVPDKYR